MENTSTCTKCQQQLIASAKFCSNCGEQLPVELAGMSIQQWREQNPKASLNDYYREYGTTINQATSYYSAPVAEKYPESNGFIPEAFTPTYTINNNTVYVQPTRSVFVALLLTFFFGPLGLFYASTTGALVMLVLDIVAFFAFTSSFVSITAFGESFGAIGLIGGIIWLVLIQWPVCILWAIIATVKHNRNVQQMSESW